MAAPGYSIFELWKTAKKAKHIWNAFTDEFENAPARVRELVETCDYLSNVLSDLTSVLDQYGENYPQEKSFDRKLLECQAFINRYRSLKSDYLTELQNHRIGVSSRRTWQQVWQTTRYAYDDKRAQELRDGLSLEIQKLLAFTMVFALRRSAPINYLNMSNTRDRLGAGSSLPLNLDARSQLALPYYRQEADPIDRRNHLHEFEALFQDLVGIRYSYEREMSSAVQGNRSPNIDPYRERLELVWHRMCLRSGLPVRNGATPPLPRDHRDLLEAPGRIYDELVITAAAPSMHGGLRTNPNFGQQTQLSIEPRLSTSSQSRPRQPSTYSSSYAPSSYGGRTGSITTPSLYGGSTYTACTTPHLEGATSGRVIPDILLPTAAISSVPSCVASIKLPNIQSRIYLLRWTIKTGPELRCVEWTTESRAQTLLHFLSPPVFPHVYHSKTSQRLDVTFDEYHQVVLTSSETTIHDGRIAVEYTFASAEDRDKFQGDVRGMTHVRAFDVDVIWSKPHPKNDGWGRFSGMARLEKLNLWQSQKFPYHHSLSFLASATSGEQQEYPLLSFSDAKPVSSDRQEARLNLGGRARRSSLQPFRRASFVGWRRRSSDSGEARSNEPLHEASISPLSPQPSDAAHLEYIAFKFTCKDECKAFKEEYERAYNEDLIPTGPPYPQDRVELENTQAPVEMGTDMDMSELENPWM